MAASSRAKPTTDPASPAQIEQQPETSPRAVEMPVDHIQESSSVQEYAREPIATPGGLDSREQLPTMANELTPAPSAMVESVAEKLSAPKEQTAVPDTSEGVVRPAILPLSPKVVPLATMEEDEVEEIEISRVAEQRRQLIKRMEPLAAENEKLKEARNLLEKNIQKAQRKRDLAESNVRDLEYQKGVLTEKLAAVFEQVRSQSKQLAAISDQLKKQDAELGQMRQAVDQLRQEKAKEAKRADKLAEELKGYRHKAKAQFDVLVQEAKVQKENFNAIIATIKLVLDYVNLEPAAQHDDRHQRPDTVI
ncbi:uncharacterized protein [Miscanthus floridulus]|uniref:uncharacterized protein n=1 Tax=Miscanthus floridulus TaxID=154761 RepID=UPI0034594890